MRSVSALFIALTPAVELANTANLGVDDGLGGVTSAYHSYVRYPSSCYEWMPHTVSKDKSLDVRGADLAAVVQDITSW